MVEQTSRRTVNSEDPCIFDIALKFVEGLGSTRHMRNSSTCCMKSKQPGIGEP